MGQIPIGAGWHPWHDPAYQSRFGGRDPYRHLREGKTLEVWRDGWDAPMRLTTANYDPASNAYGLWWRLVPPTDPAP